MGCATRKFPLRRAGQEQWTLSGGGCGTRRGAQGRGWRGDARRSGGHGGVGTAGRGAAAAATRGVEGETSSVGGRYWSGWVCQKAAHHPERCTARRLAMAWLPGTPQRIPACVSRASTTHLQELSTAPEPMGNWRATNCG